MRAVVSWLLTVAAFAIAQEAPSTVQLAPAQLIITYRAPPPRRAAFRQYMNEFGAQRFEHWKQDGTLQDYRLLFNWYVDVDTWDAMAVLTFPSFAQLGRWKEIEKTNPGGLARDGLEMAWPLNTTIAELVVSGVTDQPHNASQSVFLVTAYDVPPSGDFRDFANSYLAPQLKGWIREGVLAGYTAFANRYAGGKRWPGLLVLEYKDLDSFARRDEIAARVKAQLRNDPSWKAAAEKHKAIAEREPAIADALLPR